MQEEFVECIFPLANHMHLQCPVPDLFSFASPPAQFPLTAHSVGTAVLFSKTIMADPVRQERIKDPGRIRHIPAAVHRSKENPNRRETGGCQDRRRIN